MSDQLKGLPPHLRKRQLVAKQNEEQALILASQANTTPNNLSDSVTSPTFTDTSIATTGGTRTLTVTDHDLRAESSPMELIQHETIRSLQTQLNEANDRCKELEIKNEHLQRQLDSAVKIRQEPDASVLISSTLDGYESSEEASSRSPSPQVPPYSTGGLHIIEQILEKQEEESQKLGQTVATQEKHIQDLTARINENKQTAPVMASRELIQKVNQLDKLVMALQKKQAAYDSAQKFQENMERKVRQEQRIDQAATREDLLDFFQILSDQSQGKKVSSKSRFRGTEDEVWAFRDRVVCRLAIFEHYNKAYQEAQELMEYNGRSVKKSGW